MLLFLIGDKWLEISVPVKEKPDIQKAELEQRSFRTETYSCKTCDEKCDFSVAVGVKITRWTCKVCGTQ